MSRVPEEIRERVRVLRQQGYGITRILSALPELRSDYGITPDSLRNYVYDHHETSTLRTEEVRARLGRVAELLERSGIDPADIGKVQAVRLSEWQGLTKNPDGEAELHDLKGASIVLTPQWAEGPRWQPVDRGPAIRLPAWRKPATVESRFERCFLWPDTQVGYRRNLTTMALEPFHDETAIACALALVRKTKPHKLVIFGDFLDFPEFGTYEQEAGFALTVQPAIDRATVLLGEIRAAAGPDCQVIFIEGNHDRRLQRAISRNALAAFGLKRGSAAPEDWPVLSVPYLLRLDEHAIEYVGGYPAGIVWINENVCAIHGAKINSAGSSALRVIDDTRVSVVFGHVHRIELVHRTRQSFAGPKRSFAASMGCLCRLDGSVPSTKGSTDVFGNAVPTVENWQHGIGLLQYEPGDGRFHLDLVDIQDGHAILWGQEVTG